MTKRLALTCSSPGLGLAFADGRRWVIRALDPDAEAAVLELGKVMQLRPVQGRGRGRVCAVSGPNGARDPRGNSGHRLSCRLGPARSLASRILRMEQITAALAVQSLARGGILLHGALAVRDGAGFVLAGTSGVGKSTASRRLPLPWRSLSDDCVLVVRDARGLYWAHPWPTWSILRKKGLVKSWPVGQGVPLKALLFLRQSPFDLAEPVTITPGTALVIESAFQLARTVALRPGSDANRVICRKYLRAAWALAAAVPAYRLSISLTGQFWTEVERVSAEQCQPSAVSRKPSAVGRQRSAAGRKPSAEGGKPRLVCFQVGSRIFLKLVVGGRVAGMTNELLGDWCIQRPFRRVIKVQSIPDTKSRVQSPESRIQSPESRIQSPESRIQNPESRIQSSESRVQNPESRDQSPRSRVQSPESRVQSPRSRVQSPESRIQSPESRDQRPASRVQSPESRDQSPESRDQSPRSRVQSPESRDQSPRSKVRSPKSRVQVPEPR